MIEIIEQIITNEMVAFAGTIYGTPITIILIIVLFMKSSRDERGRAIVGKASIISTIVFIILVNFYAKLCPHIPVTRVTTIFCVQWIYNIVLTVETVAILIYKKTE